jgi:hypothetical protein
MLLSEKYKIFALKGIFGSVIFVSHVKSADSRDRNQFSMLQRGTNLEQVRGEVAGKETGEYLLHGRRNSKDTNPLMSSLLVIFVWGSEAIL